MKRFVAVCVHPTPVWILTDIRNEFGTFSKRLYYSGIDIRTRGVHTFMKSDVLFETDDLNELLDEHFVEFL